MYILDFLKSMFKKVKISTMIYLLLNICIIGAFVHFLNGQHIAIDFLIGFGIYLASIVIALSPIGECILRIQTGCWRIGHKEELEYLEPMFNEVYARAKKLNPSIPDDVKLYINKDEQANAFATGRKTICVTHGMLEMPKEQIKACLAHEFGHLANKDTDMILVVSVGNLIISSAILAVRVILTVIHLIVSLFIAFLPGGIEKLLVEIVEALYAFAIFLGVNIATSIWSYVGVLLVMKSSRDMEYLADEFAYKLGYGRELEDLLKQLHSSKSKGLFATLASSHPSNRKRIMKLKELETSISKEDFTTINNELLSDNNSTVNSENVDNNENSLNSDITVNNIKKENMDMDMSIDENTKKKVIDFNEAKEKIKSKIAYLDNKIDEKGINKKKLLTGVSAAAVGLVIVVFLLSYNKLSSKASGLENDESYSSYEIIEKSVDNTDVTEDSYTNLYTDNNEETENNQYAEKYDTNMTEDYAKLVEMSLEKMLNICAVAIYEYDKNDKYILNKKTFWSMLDYYFGMYGVTDELVDVKTAETQFGLCAGVSVDDIEKIASAYIPNFKTIPNIPIDYKMVKYSKAKDMYIFNINWDGDFFTKYKIIGYKKNEEGKIEVRIGTYDPEQISDTEFTENKVLVDASKYEANKLNEYIILLENNIFDGIDIGYSICSVNKIN